LEAIGQPIVPTPIKPTLLINILPIKLQI